jgi:hypothetical protein
MYICIIVCFVFSLAILFDLERHRRANERPEAKTETQQLPKRVRQSNQTPFLHQGYICISLPPQDLFSLCILETTTKQVSR